MEDHNRQTDKFLTAVEDKGIQESRRRQSCPRSSLPKSRCWNIIAAGQLIVWGPTSNSNVQDS